MATTVKTALVFCNTDRGYRAQSDTIMRQDEGSGVTERSITLGAMLHYSLHTREMQLQDTHAYSTLVSHGNRAITAVTPGELPSYSVKRHTGTERSSTSSTMTHTMTQ